VFDVAQFSVTLQVTNNFMTTTSNLIHLDDEQMFNVLDIFDISFEAETPNDLDSLLNDFGVSLADLDAAILDAEGGTEV
jgi:hypothetical protein